jgi:hypothetical protein
MKYGSEPAARSGAAHNTRLSKSRYMAGLQCTKRLWWTTHEPDAAELCPDPAQQALFDRGHKVGEVARQHRPGGLLIDFPYDQVDARVAATKQALDRGQKLIYEASFLQNGIFVAVDILDRQRRGVFLTEVKATLSAKPEHIPDLAVQAHVVEAAGLDVVQADVMHLNRDCVSPDLSNLFTRTDVTSEVRAELIEVPLKAARLRAALGGPLPVIAPGGQCTQPHRCPFYDRCHAELPQHHISTLYGVRDNKVSELLAQGVATVDQHPLTTLQPGPRRRQVESVLKQRLVVERGLAEVMHALEHPIAFLDFETINPAIPAWHGSSPYQRIPVQLSCHVLDGETLTHHAWLADGPTDPREGLARAVLATNKGANTVLAYNATFERSVLRDLAASVPSLRRPLLALSERLQDLLQIVRDHVYHPDFQGSFSLKSVVPALAPELSYDDLSITSGNHASFELESLLLTPTSDEETTERRSALLEYCHLDTLGMVAVYRRLLALSSARAAGLNPV